MAPARRRGTTAVSPMEETAKGAGMKRDMDLADAVRSDTPWAKAKSNVIKPTASFTFDVLKDWLKTEITQGLPTLGRLAS